MGMSVSKADTAPPAMPNFVGVSPAVAAAVASAAAGARKDVPRTDYLNLPQPVNYEDLSREILTVIKPDCFEGLRFEITKPLNQQFFLTHSLFLGNMEIPTPNKQVIKCPVGTYEFGATVVGGNQYFMLGRITTDGRMSGRAKFSITDNIALKAHCQLSNEAESQLLADLDVKGKDWNGQLKVGNPGFYGINYFQSVTPKLSMGGEFFWLAGNYKSGVGVAARHADDKHIATAQLATTGILSLQYAHKVTDKITLASDFLWHFGSREATATVGYDAVLRQCRMRGKVDTNGLVSAYLEERFTPGISFLLSAELDHAQKNYKFGFGVTAGE